MVLILYIKLDGSVEHELWTKTGSVVPVRVRIDHNSLTTQCKRLRKRCAPLMPIR